MDEALRLAYLAAMDIPVWVPRGTDGVKAGAQSRAQEVEPAGFAGAPAPPILPEPVTTARAPDAAPGRLARELLGPDPAHGPAVVRSASAATVAPQVPAGEPLASGVTRVPVLLLVMAGRHLFIDEAGDPGRDARVAALATAIAFALSGERVAASMQRFDPLASGLASDHAGARDLLLGRLAKLTEGADVEHVVLLGAVAAGVLLGWDAHAYAQRVPLAQRVAGLQCGVLVTLAADAMLRDPALKADAWRELCAARAGHGS